MKNFLKTILLSFVFTSLVQAQLPVNLELAPVFTSDLARPLTVRHASDGSGRLFIVHQEGVIKIWDGSQLLSTPFLDISSKVIDFNEGGNEQGLLGMDFDPNYTENGFFYVSYTKSGVNSGDSVIERYQVSAGDADQADVNSGQLLMRIEQPRTNHNGGDIHFGPDGYLYIGIGDGGKQGDPDGNAQHKGRLLGKMMRVDVNPDIIFKDSVELDNRCGLDPSQYYLPSDNPFIQEANSCGEIWAYGFRNPWRWSFDSLTGDLLIGDVGQGNIEEISFQESSSLGGEHYGWNCREGNTNYSGGVCNNGDTFIEPVVTHNHGSDGYCSITGGYIYRGPIVALQGLYVYTDYCEGDINFATPAGQSVWSETTFDTVNFGVASFGEDEAGNIYVIQNSNISVFNLAD